MDNDFQEIRRYFNQCDPKMPLEPGDERYVPLDEGIKVRGDEDLSATEMLERTILLWDRPEPSCQLFTGFPGSGKTTELKRLATRLAAGREYPVHVLYIDAEELLNPYMPVHVEDVLRILAWEMDRELARLTGRAADAPDSYPRRFWTFLTRTSVDFKQLEGGVELVKISAELKSNPTFRERVREAMANQLRAFADDAHAYMREAVVRIRAKTGAQAVVVILDSLEKLKAASIEQEDAVERSAETVFLTHADFLRIPCHAIYTFPLWLQFHVTGLGTTYDSAPTILPMVKIKDGVSGAAFEPGREKLRLLLEKRVNLERILGQRWQEHLGALIEASGGYPRDLIRLMREVLRRTGNRLPVEPIQVERAIRELGESYTNVFRGQDLEILAEIAMTHDLPTFDDERVRRINRLFIQMVILCYRNGRPWYDLHPMILRRQEVQDAIKERRERRDEPVIRPHGS